MGVEEKVEETEEEKGEKWKAKKGSRGQNKKEKETKKEVKEGDKEKMFCVCIPFWSLIFQSFNIFISQTTS